MLSALRAAPPRLAAAGGRGRPLPRGPLAPRAVAARLLASEAPQSPQPGNPFAVLEQMGRETFNKAQEAAQKMGEVAQSGGPATLVQELQGFAQTNAEALGRAAVPICSAALILARSPGAPLSDAQHEKLAAVLPAPVMDMLSDLVKVVPEDPIVEQLKRICDKLDTFEARMAAPPASAPPAAAPTAAPAAAPAAAPEGGAAA